MTDVKAAVEYARNHEAGFLKDLTEFIAIPSVSTSPEHKADVRAAAEWMAARLRALGMEKVELMPTGGHPVVYGEWSGAGKNRRCRVRALVSGVANAVETVFTQRLSSAAGR